MQIGELRHRVALQQATESANAFGEVIRSWTTVATVWAAVEDWQGREYLQARQMEAEVSTRIRMRERAGVAPGWRAVHGSTVYDIKAVLLDATRAREMQLMCVRVG